MASKHTLRQGSKSNLIHDSFPPMATPMTAASAAPNPDMFNINYLRNRQPTKETFGPQDTPQYG